MPGGRPRKTMEQVIIDAAPKAKIRPVLPTPIIDMDPSDETARQKSMIWSVLCETGNPSKSAAAAGVSYHQYKQWLLEDSRFAEDIAEANEIYGHNLQDRMLEQSERHPMLLIAIARKVNNGDYGDVGGSGAARAKKGARPGPIHVGDPDKLLGTDELSVDELQKRIRDALEVNLPSQSSGIHKTGSRG